MRVFGEEESYQKAWKSRWSDQQGAAWLLFQLPASLQSWAADSLARPVPALQTADMPANLDNGEIANYLPSCGLLRHPATGKYVVFPLARDFHLSGSLADLHVLYRQGCKRLLAHYGWYLGKYTRN